MDSLLIDICNYPCPELVFYPIPLVISILIAAAVVWNPLLVALVGSLGHVLER